MARYARRPAGHNRPRGPWRHGPLPVLGLIGGIGAGKSQVAALWAELGALVLDADAIGHALLDQRPARDEVLARFGAGILAPEAGADASPRIDRAALGTLVFEHPGSLRDLERILHPRMRQTFLKAIRRAMRKGEARAVVLDAAILLEAGWDDLCDRVVFVDAPEDQRRARLAERRGWSPETLAARERAQWPLDRKRGAADVVLPNESSPEALRPEATRLWEQLLRGAVPGRTPRKPPGPGSTVRPRRDAPAVPPGG
ncbi:MAG TPA: dephospho-CoA kinase [Isosphaeraceae bacterium]|jgi:dephospho-CoA kinase